MNVDVSRMRVRVRPGGVLDGSRAAEILRGLERLRPGQVVLDFSSISRFEAFGADVLVQGLAGLRVQGTTVLSAAPGSRPASRRA